MEVMRQSFPTNLMQPVAGMLGIDDLASAERLSYSVQCLVCYLVGYHQVLVTGGCHQAH